MGRGGKSALSREERVLCDRLRQITPQSRLLRVDEAVDMLRDMYAEYRRRPVAALAELVRRATDTIAADFVPRPVPRVPMPVIPAAASPQPSSAPATSATSASSTTPASGASAAASPAPPSAASSPAPAPAPAAPRRDPAAEARARERRIEEAGSVLNRALVERYKAVCISLHSQHATHTHTLAHHAHSNVCDISSTRDRATTRGRRGGRRGCGGR